MKLIDKFKNALDSTKRVISMKEDRNKGNVQLATTALIGLVVFLFVVFSALYGISVLNPTSFFTAGSNSANATLALQDNTTAMVSNFSQQIPTVGKILGVILILGIIGVMIAVILMFAARARQATGSGGSVL